MNQNLTLELLQTHFEGVKDAVIGVSEVTNADVPYNLLWVSIPDTDIALITARDLLMRYPAVSVLTHSTGVTLYFKENQPECGTHGFYKAYYRLFGDLLDMYRSAVGTAKFFRKPVRVTVDNKERVVDQFILTDGKDDIVRFCFYDEDNFKSSFSESYGHFVLCKLAVVGKTTIKGEFLTGTANVIFISLMRFTYQVLKYWDSHYTAINIAKDLNLDIVEASLALSKLKEDLE